MSMSTRVSVFVCKCACEWGCARTGVRVHSAHAHTHIDCQRRLVSVTHTDMRGFCERENDSTSLATYFKSKQPPVTAPGFEQGWRRRSWRRMSRFLLLPWPEVIERESNRTASHGSKAEGSRSKPRDPSKSGLPPLRYQFLTQLNSGQGFYSREPS